MTSEPTVLVVDDEPEIVELMRDFLEAGSFGVVTASTGDEALTALGRASIDCVLLDVMMPGMSGFEALRQIRERDDVPVLFLSARDGDADKIRGLGLGADDYIVKSATPAEVVARVKAVLRRSGRLEAASSLLDFGRLVVDLTAREVRVAGEPVPFTPREFDLLRLLAAHPRRAFGREELFERLWGGYGDLHTVTVHVARVREKIEEDPTQPRLLVTVRGMGYRFEGERR
jgi:DNA-binding response OmpR family regulator